MDGDLPHHGRLVNHVGVNNMLDQRLLKALRSIREEDKEQAVEDYMNYDWSDEAREEE